MKIRSVGAKLFHMDGRTDGQQDMMNLIVTLRNFSKAPKNHKFRPNILPTYFVQAEPPSQ
jgi:hypothetical protein